MRLFSFLRNTDQAAGLSGRCARALALTLMLGLFFAAAPAAWAQFPGTAQSSKKKDDGKGSSRITRVTAYVWLAVVGVAAGVGLFQWTWYRKEYKLRQERPKEAWELEPAKTPPAKAGGRKSASV